MMNIRSIGVAQAAKADFGDQARHAKEQGNYVIEDILKAVQVIIEGHFPRRSVIGHNGLEIIVKGRTDEEQGEIVIEMRTLRVAGGM